MCSDGSASREEGLGLGQPFADPQALSHALTSWGLSHNLQPSVPSTHTRHFTAHAEDCGGPGHFLLEGKERTRFAGPRGWVLTPVWSWLSMSGALDRVSGAFSSPAAAGPRSAPCDPEPGSSARRGTAQSQGPPERAPWRARRPGGQSWGLLQAPTPARRGPVGGASPPAPKGLEVQSRVAPNSTALLRGGVPGQVGSGPPLKPEEAQAVPARPRDAEPQHPEQPSPPPRPRAAGCWEGSARPGVCGGASAASGGRRPRTHPRPSLRAPRGRGGFRPRRARGARGAD